MKQSSSTGDCDDEDGEGSSSTWYICNLCKRIFPHKNQLKSHRKSEHLQQIRENLLQKRGQSTNGGQDLRANLPASSSSTCSTIKKDNHDVRHQKVVPSDSVSIQKVNEPLPSNNEESNHEEPQENLVQSADCPNNSPSSIETSLQQVPATLQESAVSKIVSDDAEAVPRTDILKTDDTSIHSEFKEKDDDNVTAPHNEAEVLQTETCHSAAATTIGPPPPTSMQVQSSLCSTKASISTLPAALPVKIVNNNHQKEQNYCGTLEQQQQEDELNDMTIVVKNRQRSLQDEMNIEATEQNPQPQLQPSFQNVQCVSCKEKFGDFASFQVHVSSCASLRKSDNNHDDSIDLNKPESTRNSYSTSVKKSESIRNSLNFPSLQPSSASTNNNNKKRDATMMDSIPVKVTEADKGGDDDDKWTVEFWQNDECANGYEPILIKVIPAKQSPSSTDSEISHYKYKYIREETVEETPQYMPPPAKKLKRTQIPTQEVKKKTKKYPKPTFTYNYLAYMALKNAKNQILPTSTIFKFICRHFPYFKTKSDNKWKGRLRTSLAQYSGFIQLHNVPFTSAKGVQGIRVQKCWGFSPSAAEEMDRLLFDKIDKNRARILSSMSDPCNLDLMAKGMLTVEEEKKKKQVMINLSTTTTTTTTTTMYMPGQQTFCSTTTTTTNVRPICTSYLPLMSQQLICPTAAAAFSRNPNLIPSTTIAAASIPNPNLFIHPRTAAAAFSQNNNLIHPRMTVASSIPNLNVINPTPAASIAPPSLVRPTMPPQFSNSIIIPPHSTVQVPILAPGMLFYRFL